MSRRLPAALVLAAFVSAAGCIAAQAANAPAPARPTLGGPPIKGVCLLSEEAVLQQAKAAVAANQRLEQLKAQAQAEVNAARGPLDADLKALQADAAKTPPAEVEKRRQALQARYQTVQDLADQRTREIEATRAKVLARLSSEMQPVLAAAYKAHGCGLLFNRNAVLGGNLEGDLTPEVVKGLDARVTSIPFDREVLAPVKK